VNIRICPHFRLENFVLLILSLSFCPAVASSQNSQGEVTENLKRIREQIEKEEDRLNTLKENQSQLQAQVDRVSAEAAKASDQKQRLLNSVEQLKTETERMSKTVGKFQQDIENRKDGLRTRAVALYKTQRRTVALDYLFHADSSTDLLKRARYLTAVANYDRNYMQGLRKLVESLARDQKQLDELQSERQVSLDQAQSLENELRKKREQAAGIAAEQRDKVRQQEKSIDKLRASAAKFEELLASIMGGEKYEPPLEEENKETSEPVETVKIEPAPSPQVALSPYSGPGLASFRGRLSFPVPGEIVQRYGKQKHEEFADMLFVKGLEIRSLIGAKVKAVAAGKVVLSQVLPGYGNVIIVDHGERYYTLYGRLASSLKSVGQIVQAGEELAVLGETDYKGRNFYFELRIKGKATNPTEYFRDPPARGDA